MTYEPLNAALEAAHKKLSELLLARLKIDQEIMHWAQLRDSLLAVIESEGDVPPAVEVSRLVEGRPGRASIKFTEAVRMVLRQNAGRSVPISVPEMRQQLTNLGFDFSKYSQPLVPIHNALRRLAEQGEVDPIKSDQGQTLGYRWISPVERALSEDGLVYGEISASRLEEMARETNQSLDEVVDRYRTSLDDQREKCRASRKSTRERHTN